MIELRNIDLSAVDEMEQLNKFGEEIAELYIAMAMQNNEEVIEETWDVIQALIGIVFKERNITAYELMEGYPKHLEKLKNRPRVKDEKEILEKNALDVKRIKFFENPIQRHKFINEKLIHNRKVRAIHTGRDEEKSEFYVEWRERV